MEEFKGAFSKLSETEVDEFGLPYDFCSVMHYADWAFSKDKKIPTIETLDPSKQDIIGKAKGVSEGDIMLLRRMYKCGPQSTTTDTPLSSQATGLKGKESYKSDIVDTLWKFILAEVFVVFGRCTLALT